MVGGHKNVAGYLSFCVKMDFTRKVQWILDGHKNISPKGSTYAGVVSRESVRIEFTYSELNGIKVFEDDTMNICINALTSEKNYIACGTEF